MLHGDQSIYNRAADSRAAANPPARTCWELANRLPAAAPDDGTLLEELADVDDDDDPDVAAVAMVVEPDAEELADPSELEVEFDPPGMMVPCT